MISAFKEAAWQFSSDRCSTLAAGIAYYTVFSLPPLLFVLLMTLTVGLQVFTDGQKAEQRAHVLIQAQASQMLGNDAAEDEIGKILKASGSQEGLGWKAVLGLAGVLFGATGVVVSLQDSLNRVWGIKADPKANGIKTFLWKRILSLGMILGLGFVLLVSFLITTMLKAATEAISSRLGIDASAALWINLAVTFLIVTVVFAAIFRFMPDARIAWRDVIIGAIVTSLLFALGRFALSWYLSFSDPGQQLGSAAASLVVILVWVYYSSMIVLFGAEFTQAWSRQSGRELVPEKGAVRFTEQVIAS